MIKTTILSFAVLALAGSTALAAGDTSYTLSKDKKTTMAAPAAPHFTPALNPGKTPNNVFSNIGYKYPKGLYFCCYGDTISGSTSQIGQTFWLAAAFTPAADATVKKIEAGVGWVSGANKVEITLYDDAGGPGTVLATGEATALGGFGDCCKVATLKIKDGVAVTGGATYWVSVTTDGATSSTWAAWNLNSTDQIDPVTIASSDGTGWTVLGGSIPGPAFSVITTTH